MILSRHTTRISSLTKINTNMHKCIPNGMSANYAVQASMWLWAFSKPMDVSVLGIGIRSRKYADTLLRACVYPDTPLRWPPCLRRYAISPIAAYNSIICRHADRCLYAETLLIAVVRPSLHVTFLSCFAGVPIGSNCIITHYADMPIAVLTPIAANCPRTWLVPAAMTLMNLM